MESNFEKNLETVKELFRGERGSVSLESFSAEETFELGRSIGDASEAGTVIALDGDLGAGKTVITQGIAAGLGFDGPVKSPTFTILSVHAGGRMPLYHFDAYRIGDISEMDEIGWEDCFFGEGISVVEWSGLISEIIPEDAVRITIERDAARGADYRSIKIER